MGLSPSRGTLSRPSVPLSERFDIPPSEVKEITPKTLDVSLNKILESSQHISETANALNSGSKDSDMIKKIIGFAEGQNISVTFYHALNSPAFQQTALNKFDTTLDTVHYSFLKINNFQLKVNADFAINYDPEGVSSQYTGEAYCYPHFIPNIGDMFIYNVGSGHMGIFYIYEAPIRLSIKDTTYHSIRFILDRFITTEFMQKLEACVEKESYFSLQRSAADNGVLLTTDENKLITDIQKISGMLMHYYCDEFYESKVYNTFIYFRNLYDPYILEFITKVIDYSVMPGYPTQLKSNPEHWKRSFWFRLLNPDQVPENVMLTKTFRVLQTINYRTAGVNALANRYYLHLSSYAKRSYPPFEIPAIYDATEQTLPMMIRLYFDQQKIRPAIILDIAKTIVTRDRFAQFYFIPIIIFLLKKALDALYSGKDIIVNEGVVNPTSIPIEESSSSSSSSCTPDFIPCDGGPVSMECVPCEIHGGDLTAEDIERMKCHWHIMHTHHHRNNMPICLTEELDIHER